MLEAKTPGAAPMGVEKFGAKLVLVVDDNDDIRHLLRTFLEGKGYHVSEARDGREALAEAGREAPDLVIMDLNMPVLDGIGAVRQLRNLDTMRSVPLMIMTGYGDFGIKLFGELDDTAPAGGEYLTKPIDLKELEYLIGELLGGGETRGGPPARG